MTAEYQYLFGPVPSRRLGLSLGVDLLTPKTCTFDCPFCQAGKTTSLTVSRQNYVPIDAVIDEFRKWLASGGTADCITLAGSGEPTLHKNFGRAIDAIHELCGIRVVLLSNATLFHDPDVRADAVRADVVKASFSAWDEASFREVNHPHVAVKFSDVLSGIGQLRKELDGELWLEVMIVNGVNSDHDQVKAIAELASGLGSDKIHLNTVVRPPADGVSTAVTIEELGRMTRLFTPEAEVISRTATNQGAHVAAADSDEILALIRRRPCTGADIVAGLGIPASVAEETLGVLLARGLVAKEKRGSDVYYRGQ